MVAGLGDHADFVFDLHHDHRVLIAVDLLEVLHQRGERFRVGGDVRFAEGREDLDAAAVLAERAREAILVHLDPLGRVARHAVLPTAEPEEDEPQVVAAGRFDEAIDEREVELAFARLDEVPIRGDEHRVEIQLHQPRPDRLHRFERRGGGIAEFAADDEKRLAVDDELRRGALFGEVGEFGARPLLQTKR